MISISTLKRNAGKVAGLAAGAVVAFAGNAMALADPDVSTAVTSGTSTLSDTIQAGIPLILAVTVFWVVLGLGKRLLRKAGG